MAKKKNPKAVIYSEIAEDFSAWILLNPKTSRKKKITQFNAIADAHFNMRNERLRVRRGLGVERPSSPVR